MIDRRPEGLLFDLDGTLYEGERAIRGAAAAVEALRDGGVQLRFVTNTTRQPRRALVERLQRLGISAGLDELFTAPLAAAIWLKEHGFRRLALCLPSHTFEDFSDFAIDEERPEAVVVGDLGPEWTFERINRAFRWLLAGAEFVALHRNRYWKTADGLTIDAGAFVTGLEYASGKVATLVGKPSRPLFEAAVHSMGLEPEAVAMVGDDLTSDVAGAQTAGSLGILVRTGKFREEQLASSEVKPDLVVDSVAALPNLLGC